MRLVLLFPLLFVAGAAAAAPAPRDGWVVMPTAHPYAALVERVKAAAVAAKMAVVTEAGPTAAAAARGVTIPGNRVIGVFRNDFAVRMLAASEAAMIEAPIRFYVTEEPDGTAALSWKTPSFVFAPYAGESPEVAAIAAELDAIFSAIGEAAR